MDSYGPSVSPATGAFVAAILGEPDPADTAAFVAAILGETLGRRGSPAGFPTKTPMPGGD